MQKPNDWETALLPCLAETGRTAASCRPRGLVLLAAAVLLLGGCAAFDKPQASSPAPATENAPAQQPAAEPEQSGGLGMEQRVTFRRGVAALRDGNGVVGVRVFSDLVEQRPELAAAWANLGTAHMLRGDAGKAMQAYDKALALDASLADVQVRLGVLYRRADRLEDARAAYLAAIATDPDNRLAHLNLGILYDLYLHEPARALKQYRRFQALSDSPDEEVKLWIADLEQRL